MERTVVKIERRKASAPIPKQTRVAAYARVSLGTEHMLHSLAAQVGYYSEYIQNRAEWKYAGVYADEAKSGTDDGRPEFQRLITDCREGKIDAVITKSISRFARNTVTLLETVRELKALGIDIFFEEQNIHTLSGDGELMLTILASYAQEESRSVSENIKWRKRSDMEKGRTKPTRVYGYTVVKGKLEIKPEEADIVRMMFTDYLGGLGHQSIANKLNRMGIKSPTGRSWHSSVVRNILHNEKMYGDLRLQKKFVEDHISKKKKLNRGELPMYIVKGTHDGIIDKATFDAVQTEAARRDETGSLNSHDGFAFKSMLKCGICGRNFWRTSNGKKWWKQPVWVCGGRDKRSGVNCSAKQVPEDILMAVTADVLGLVEFDGSAVKEKIAVINIPEKNVLEFILKDGTSIHREWQNKSHGPNPKYDGRRNSNA